MTRVLLVADASFTRREHQMLNRLDVGLSDEGMRVSLVCPRDSVPVRRGSLSETVGFDPPGPFVSTRARAVRVVESLEWRASDEPVIVHAWGGGCWSLAVELAAVLRCALVVEVWAQHVVRRLVRLEHRVRRRRTVASLVLSAPSGALRDAAEATHVRAPVRLVHWGVYALPRAHERDPHAPLSVAVLATGVEPDAVASAIEGVAACARRGVEMLVLLDDRAVRRRPALWEALRDAGLLDSATLVANIEAQREAVLEADVLLQPESTGEIRSMTLDALASGMVVLAQRDLASDTLRGDSPAMLLEDPTPRAWELAVQDAIDDPARYRGIDFVRHARRASDQIAALLGIYGGVLSPIGDSPIGDTP